MSAIRRMFLREIPIVIIVVTASAMILEYFWPHPSLKAFSGGLNTWGTILFAFSLIIALYATTMVHLQRTMRRAKGQWYYSIIFLVMLYGTILLGVVASPGHELYVWLFVNVVGGVYGAMLGSSGFYMFSSVFRVFRMRTLEGSVLVLCAFFVMLGNTTLGEFIWAGSPTVGAWINNVGSTAANRGFFMCTAIGTLGYTARLFIGRERAVMIE
jgi:hypothetical protein